MKDWFYGLEPRERLVLGAGAAVLALVLVYALIWDPLAGRYRQLQERVASQQETLIWMQQAAIRIKALRGAAPGGGRGLGGRSLMAVVDQSARAGGLADSIKRIEPDGTKGVKVWLEGAAFDPMVIWLGDLARNYGVEAGSLSIEPQGAGRVNARLTLSEPSASP